MTRARPAAVALVFALAVVWTGSAFVGAPATAQEAAPVADWKSPDYAKIFGDPDDEKDHEKRLTAYMIGVRRVKSAMPILNGVVTSHRSPLVREAAAWALGRIGDYASIAPLEKAMADPDPRVRAAAIDAIGNYDVTDTFAMLEKIANGPAGDEALLATKALASKNDPTRGPYLARVKANRPDRFLARGKPLTAKEGKSYYVDATSGSDKNPGTQSQPFKTMDRAIKAVAGASGDRVFATSGDKQEPFRESVDVPPDKSGVVNQPTFLGAWPGRPAPVIDLSRKGKPGQTPSQVGLRVRASYVEVRGFVVRGAYSGIDIDGARGCVVAECTVERCLRHGIFFYYSPEGTIIDPRVSDTDFQGISVRSSPRAVVIGGRSINNKVNGLLFLWESDDALVHDFTAQGNQFGIGFIHGSNAARVIRAKFEKNRDADVYTDADSDAQMIDTAYSAATAPPDAPVKK